MIRRGPGTLAGHAGDSLPARFGVTRGAVAAITTIVAVGVAVSLLPPLVSLTLAGRGFSERTIGFVISTIAVASLLTSPFAARIAVRFGAANVIATVTPIAALLIPLVWLTSDLTARAHHLRLWIVISLCFTLSVLDRRRHAASPWRGWDSQFSRSACVQPNSRAGRELRRPYLIGSALMAFLALPAFPRAMSRRTSVQAPPTFPSYLFAVPAATLGVFAFGVAEEPGSPFCRSGAASNFNPATAPLLPP
jgi:hypothetical protein